MNTRVPSDLVSLKRKKLERLGVEATLIPVDLVGARTDYPKGSETENLQKAAEENRTRFGLDTRGPEMPNGGKGEV